MPKLGLGNKASSASSMITPGIVTDGLVMKHMYPARAVQKLSDAAAYFDGVNSHVQLADPFNYQTLTFSAWIYRIDNNATHIIFSNQDGNTDGFFFYVSDDEHVRCGVNSTATDEVAGKTNIIANTWNHVVAMVTDNSKLEIYVNGVFADDKSLSGSIGSTTNARIGLQSHGTANDFKGYICNAGFWNRILTPTEIKSIMFKQYADLTTSEKTSLVSFWNLDEAYDSSSFVLDNHHGGGDTLSSNLWDNSATVSTGSGWTWDGSVGHAQSDDTDAGDFKQAESIEGDTVYKTVFTISDYVKGQVRIKLTSANDSNDYYGTGTSRNANGTYTEYIRTNSTGASENFEHITFQTYGSTDDNFKVSDIQIYKVNGNTGTLS